MLKPLFATRKEHKMWNFWRKRKVFRAALVQIQDHIRCQHFASKESRNRAVREGIRLYKSAAEKASVELSQDDIEAIKETIQTAIALRIGVPATSPSPASTVNRLRARLQLKNKGR
ncbi:hypothetical protein COY45_02775 [Candidatus Berkelbacteria bacterium CG_4_10_14_0_8_um_filter_42_34]|uniref:Uncharacterized protein n=1 Tax=Candidatus Berkelbacteria bacterium CG_4_10_14_0_8_um_filter_42_34 TaxID=1974502 RepID=A0A2M7SWX0_9BACT|nr:MAG: hypothetical protein COY45_02775 [Candidatus Berkelbacteria bacterium CG_4_10_14_0_8_um_filter_42_34]